MKLRALCLALAIPLFTAMQTAHAESSLAIQQMANLLMKMEKNPDAKQRQLLQDLANNAPSVNEQRLAKGILTIDGSLSDEGKQEVWGVLRQVTAADGERELAKVINRFNGSATAEEKARLTALLPESARHENKAEKKTAKKSEQAAKKAEKKSEKGAKSANASQ